MQTWGSHPESRNLPVPQYERFSGLLVLFIRGLLRDILRGFEEMNRALKEPAERQ